MRKGLNKAELARLLGVSPAAVNQFEKGANNPKTEVLLKLNKVLLYDFVNGCPIEQNTLNDPGVEYRVTKIIEPETNDDQESITKMTHFISPGYAPIPVYDDTDGANNIEELINNESIKPVVVIMKGHLRCDVVVRHNDKAMDKDFLEPGYIKCQLGIKRVINFKKKVIPGMAAIIVLEEFTITRYVFESENKNSFLFRSAQPELYPDMLVDKEDVLQMWKIKSITPVVASKILMY